MKKLIRLKPMGAFFFGTNKTFSDENLHDVSSSYFPQQTHLLGMLRYFLLHTNGYLRLRKRGRWVKSRDFKDAFEIVGGYDKNNQNQKEESFGIINSISPVFLISSKEDKIKDFHFTAPKDTGVEIAQLHDGISYIANKHRKKAYIIKNYTSKVGLVDALTTSVFWKSYFANKIEKIYDKSEPTIDKEYLKRNHLLSYDDIFKRVEQVGNKRDPKTKVVSKDDEGSFYKKTSFDLNDGYEFGFVVDISQDMFKKTEGFVYLGAERSLFRIKVEDFKDEYKRLLPHSSSDKKARCYIALSDIYLKSFDEVEYMINSSYTPHAHLKRDRQKQHRASSKRSKSDQQNYIPRGSAIIFKDSFNKSTLDTKIGYNTLIQGVQI